jgi:hypothetical protein
MKFEKLQPGITVWDCHSHYAGNTKVKTWGTWPVRIVEIDTDKRKVLASWNNNETQWYSECRYTKWLKDKPLMVRTVSGYRKATREEIKAHNAKIKGG